MHRLISLMLIVVGVLLGCSEQKIEYDSQIAPSRYPQAKKVDTVDHYFGTAVPAPYRWMEDLESPAVAKWVKKQNELTFSYLDSIPFRSEINQRLNEVWNYPKYRPPFRVDDQYFFFKNTGLQDQSVLYTLDTLEGQPDTFLNPNKFSQSGTIALKNVEADSSGAYMAYSVSKGGSDWEEIRVRHINKNRDLRDTLQWIKFSGIAWFKKGFYYSRYPAPPKGEKLSKKNRYHKVYYHQLGTPQRTDRLVYQDTAHPLRNFTAQTTDDEKYLILRGTKSTSGNSLKIKNLAQGDTFTNIIDHFEHEYNLIGHINDRLLFRTNDDAPRYRVISIDPDHPQRKNWETVLPEKEMVLQSVERVQNQLLVKYMKDASSRLYTYDLQGNQLHQLKLPALGTVRGINGSKKDSLVFYAFTSFTYPTTIYKYNVNANKSMVYQQPDIDFDPDNYVTKQVFYKNKDGTEVPLFIVHKKGIKKDGKRPTLLYGYGGFNISIVPNFSVSRLILLENNGVYASACLRGGGEYGEKWHKAGMRLKKQNVFNDFVSAGEYLKENNFTSSERLAIYGRSNGGLLIGATMTQQPDFCQVAFPAVGVMDMLRYHKFTIGWAWTEEYGSSEDSLQFENLYSYSPLHNIEDTCYPATLVTTADRDDRVVPAHSFKFTATLQAHQQCNNPTLIRIETKAGHGAGTPTSKEIQQAADRWSFMFYNMDIKPDTN